MVIGRHVRFSQRDGEVSCRAVLGGSEVTYGIGGTCEWEKENRGRCLRHFWLRIEIKFEASKRNLRTLLSSG